jgi:hypothetical protein
MLTDFFTVTGWWVVTLLVVFFCKVAVVDMRPHAPLWKFIILGIISLMIAFGFVVQEVCEQPLGRHLGKFYALALLMTVCCCYFHLTRPVKPGD